VVDSPALLKVSLKNRQFSVRLGACLSGLFDQEMGVPQGSVLFALKINSVKAISPGVECSLYVDDFLIVYRSKYIHIIERHLQRSLNMLSHWAGTNGFKFSSSKTVYMHFCRLNVLIQIQNLHSVVLSSLLLIKPNSLESFLTISSHSFHTFVILKKSV